VGDEKICGKSRWKIMQLTQKIRIFPTEEQKEVLWNLSEKCRLIYNFALAERINAWENGIKGIGYTKQQNDLPEIKEKYPEYRWVYSRVLQMILKTLAADYKSFFALRKNGHIDAEPPGFKGWKYFTTMVYNQSGFEIDNDHVVLSHFYNDVPLKFKIPEKYQFEHIYQIGIFMDNEEYYLSVVYEKPEKKYRDNGKYQAVDLGITDIVTAVNMDGKFYEKKNPRPDKYWEPIIAEIQSRRDHCRKRSRKWKYYHKILRKYRRKLSNQIRDFLHKQSRRMIDNTKANTIIVGDLDVKDMARKKEGDTKRDKGLHRSTHNTGYLSRFVGFLTYKAELAGKRVIEIDEKRTTKECCVCKKIHEMEIWDRIMICDCGNRISRDKNSAVNIMARFLSQNAKWTGYRRFVDNLRQTGLDLEFRYSQEAPSNL
jgi:putative transposase